MFKNTKERTRAIIYDADNFRFVFDKPADETIIVDAPYIFRSIIHGTNFTWRQLAAFAGLRSSSEAFNVAFRSRRPPIVKQLNAFIVIDDVEHKVYFYDKDHKPEGVPTEHIGPKIVNGITSLKVHTKIPARVLSRMTITAPENMQLVMSISPKGGYMFDEQDHRLAIPNSAWVVTSTAKILNQILRTIYFMATEPGNGEIVVKVDDMSGALGGAMSTSVVLTIEETKSPSIPSLTVPGEQSGIIGEYGDIDPILVSDEDKKFIQVKIQPFGCVVTGFKGRLDPVEPNSFHIVIGTPDNLNNELSALKIKPYQEKASLGIEMRCELITQREYIRISATLPESDGTDTTEEAVVAPEVQQTAEKQKVTEKPQKSSEEKIVTEDSKQIQETKEVTPPVTEQPTPVVEQKTETTKKLSLSKKNSTTATEGQTDSTSKDSAESK